MRLRGMPVAMLVLAVCVSVTVLGIRIALEERRVSCSEAMFSGSAAGS